MRGWCASRAAAPTIEAIDEAAIRRAAKGPIELIRDGNFLAIVGADETVVEAVAAMAPGSRRAGTGSIAINPSQEEARWLLQQPSIDQLIGPPPPAEPAPIASRHEATYSRMHVAHASVAPSCGLALTATGI